MNARDPRQDAQRSAHRLAATPRGVGVTTDHYAECAKNTLFWDVEGRRYVDLMAGIAVVNTGHRHPHLIQAAREQLNHSTYTASQITPYDSYVELTERLNTTTPDMHAKRTAFFTTGIKVVEDAIKIARAHTGHPGVIALTGTFHGRTSMGISLTDKVVSYKTSFGPFPGSIYHVPTPVALHGVSTQDALDVIQRLFKADIDPRQVAIIIFEPIQGEDDFCQMLADFIRAIRALCDEHGIVMVADEVQTGFTRTGKLFAMEHTSVLLDITTMTRSLADDLPLLAVTGRAETMGTPAPGRLGGTCAGSPLVVASTHTMLDIIAGEKPYERSATLDARLVGALGTAKTKRPRVAGVRSVGAMVAVEFNTSDGKPDADFTKFVQQRALEAGLLLLSCGMYGNVIRFLLPLTVEGAVFEEGLAILQRALEG